MAVSIKSADGDSRQSEVLREIVLALDKGL